MTTFEAPRVEVVENALEPDVAPQPRRRVKRRTINTVIWFVVLLALTAIVLYPLVWLFFSTFKPSSEFGQNPGLIPENPTVANYVKVVEGIAGTPLWRFFANSFFIAIMAVIGTLFSSALAAYAFARIRFRGVGILFAAMIGKVGEAKTEEWLRGVKANLAQKPSGGDRETARDVAAGKCDLGIGNTYYWALMNDRETDKKAWADATKVILPTFKDGGTHVNISGVVVAKYAPNRANASKFIEWMVGEKAQRMHADLTYEYPVRSGIAINKTIAGYGPLKADQLTLSQIAQNRKKASVLVDKVGFDN